MVHLDGRPAEAKPVRDMAAVAPHRGTVAQGWRPLGAAALVYLQDRGNPPTEEPIQPVSAVQGRVHIVCDARLDNRAELGEELDEYLCATGSRNGQRQGGAANPDPAELILAAYLRWGEACPRRLLGDFAFVVWDQRNDSVFCARDVFGVKPLHYSRRGATLCIASEAQQILQHPEVPSDLDEIALGSYLVDDTRDESRTFFRAVQRLPPAHSLVATSEQNRLRRFWRLGEAGSEPRLPYRRRGDYAEHLLDLLQASVSDRLADTAGAVGLFMSGGLDSCTLASLCQETLRAEDGPCRLKAMSYSFPTLESCSELLYTTAMESELGIDVTRVDAEAEWLLRSPQHHRPSLESPFQGWEGVDAKIFSSLRDHGAKVALTGLGGDNLFQGSVRVFRSLIRRGRFPDALKGLWEHGRWVGLSFPRSVYRYCLGPSLPTWVDRGFRSLLGHSPDNPVPPWIEPEFAKRVGLRQRLESRRAKRYQDPARQSHYEILSHLESVGRACSWQERKAAPYGIEMRHPFLDRRLAEFAFSTPPEQHFAGRERKSLLRRAMQGRLPEIVRARRGKTAFGAFFDLSLREREDKQVQSLIENSRLSALGLIDGQKLMQAYLGYCRGERPEVGNLLWYVLTLELWLGEFVVLGAGGPLRALTRGNKPDENPQFMTIF